jgi:hypothetical protein
MRCLLVSVGTLVVLMGTCDVVAAGAIAEVELVDRDSGARLPTHYYRGEYWVAGKPGARYAIEISSRESGRVLAVTSVDGVNVISGETAAWDQTGYVFEAGSSYQITGWRKSDREVAAFTFTALPDSYAARTGRPANVGVIGVALFRERQPVPGPAVAQSAPAPENGMASRSEARDRVAGAATESESALARPALPQGRIGTGHGAREYSYVQNTRFERLQETPNEVIRIRYDSPQNLIAMGILPRPRPQPARPEAFPDSKPSQFVPDPPG